MTEELRALFARYKQTGDVEARNKIVEQHLYIAEIIAKKFVGRGVPYEDLLQEASMAIISAVDRFDPDEGAKFSTYLTPTITGEIKNYFRDKSRMISLPRRLNDLNVAVKKFCEKYVAKEGVMPTAQEIAKTLGVSEEEVIKVFEISGTLSLDQADSETEKGGARNLLEALPFVEEEYERVEMRETLKDVMQDLPEVDKKLIAFRYFENLSQTETANRLGVSQMYVSRAERRLMKLLKERLQED